MNDVIEKLEVYAVDLPGDAPYMGELRDGENINARGYFVRRGNRTVYPRTKRSLVVRLQTRDGVEGWGETYGLIAPQATAAIINDLLQNFVVGRDPFDVVCLHEDLYNLMRVRGYTGGFYLDALAAIDIATWDTVGKLANQPVARMLGGQRRQQIPAYISGLPENTLERRCDLAASWQQRGFDAFKFALPVADAGATKEITALRDRLGEQARIACDMHWKHSRDEATSLAHDMARYRPWFLEAPVATEDVDGLQWVAQHAEIPIAVGEEWRSVYEARARIDRQACHIVQPEMGHTGITEFMRIGQYAQAHHLRIIPHATIGLGVFLAASLQASAALQDVAFHEYQHSVFDHKQHYLNGNLTCHHGAYHLPEGPGLGVEPSPQAKAHFQLLS